MNASGPDTIAAVATPPGEGGVGIIRISGPQALKSAQTVLDIETNCLEPRRAVLSKFKSIKSNQILDSGLVIYFAGPNSYTGEDVVEMNCHGSPLLLDTLLGELLENEYTRLAEPGEFTRRAFENKKLDLAQADAVAEIISARSKTALKSAARQLEGELSELVSRLREALIYCRARLEATFDFDEEDSVGAVPSEELIKKLNTIHSKINTLIAEGKQGHLIAAGCHTAIVGKPNVGKSSLFNKLLKNERAIVTIHPGTTRDILKDQLTIDGIPFILHDTAGIRGTANDIEAMGIERSESAIKKADLVIFLLDKSRELDGEDDYIFELLDNKKLLVVMNKCDLTEKITANDLQNRFGLQADCHICTLKDKGLKSLKNMMLKKVKGDKIEVENPLVTRQRHLDLLKQTNSAIETALSGLETGKDEVLIAEDLREASSSAARITGKITTDDILDEIFANFCIGK